MFGVKQHPEYLALYNDFKDAPFDRIISYEEMSKVLPNNGDVRGKYSWALYKFIQLMLTDQNKALENIPNIGYRVAKPNEHVRLSNKHSAKAVRQAKKAVEKVTYCDVSQLSEETRMEVMMQQNRKMLIYGLLLGEKRKLKKNDAPLSLPSTPPSFKR